MTDFTITGYSAVNLDFTDARWLPKIESNDLEISFQAHHIIPNSVGSNSELLTALRENDLFDYKSFVDNGIPLSASSGEAEMVGLTVHHRGPHSEYNNFFSNIVSKLEADWVANGGGTANLDDYAAKLRGIVAHLRVEFNTPGTDFRLYQNSDFWTNEATLFDAQSLNFRDGSLIGGSDLYQSGGLRSDGSVLTLDHILPWTGEPDSADLEVLNDASGFRGLIIDVSPANVERFSVSGESRWAVLLRAIEEDINIEGTKINKIAGAIDLIGKAGTIADPLEFGWTMYKVTELSETDPQAAEDLLADYVGGTAGGIVGWLAGAALVGILTPEPVSTALGAAGMFALTLAGAMAGSIAGDAAGEAVVGAMVDHLQEKLADGEAIVLDTIVDFLRGSPVDETGAFADLTSSSDVLLSFLEAGNVYLTENDGEIFAADGGEIIYGSSGVDTIQVNANASDFAGQTLISGGVKITNIISDEAITLFNVERIEFNDVTTDQYLRSINSTQTSLISGLGGEAGFGENILDRNDDDSTSEIDITSIFEGGLNFFGREFTSLWINNNGSVTFNGARSEYTPDVITQNNSNPEITPFFADVDTWGGATFASSGGTSTGSNLVYYDFDLENDRFIVTWDDVGYYSSNTDKTNAFQLILTDTGNGDFDIQFRYENVDWTTGNASGGSGGLGGTPARAGFTASTGDPDAYFELPASGDQDALLALDETVGNTGQVGIWEFSVRSGDISSADLPELPNLGASGSTVGDPHLVTLDGVPYDFHAAGEFVLMRATNGSDFEVQVRTIPVEGNENLSVNGAIAARLGGADIMIDATDENALSVNGEVFEVENFSYATVGNDYIFRSNNVYTLVFVGADGVLSDGDTQLEITVLDGRLDFAAYVGADLLGNLEGLLGNADGDPSNDIALADGAVLARPLSYAQIYGEYRDDWRVSTTEQSLFSYDEGESLEGFYLADHPATMISVDSFSEEELSTASAVLLEAGLVEGSPSYNNALIDYLATADESYVESAVDQAELLEDNHEGGEEAEVITDVVYTEDPVTEFFGTSGSDSLTGSALDDTILGYGGNDTLVGNRGADLIKGGTGEDRVLGGSGNDRILGQADNDQLLGHSGNDTLLGGGGADVLSGSAGDDFLAGHSGNDTLRGGKGEDLLKGNGGLDILSGGGHADNLLGGGGNDRLSGQKGNDDLSGQNGNDNLSGGTGNDTISGGKGVDTIIGGKGNDILSGGSHSDSFLFNLNQKGHDQVLDFAGNDSLTFSNVDESISSVEGFLDAYAQEDGADVMLQFNNRTSLLIEQVSIEDIAGNINLL